MALALPFGRDRARFPIPPIVPGLIAAVGAAIAARQLAAVTPLPAVFYALLVGMAIGSCVPADAIRAGGEFAARTILRFGVALLGTAITLSDILGLGAQTAAITLTGLVVTLFVGAKLATLFGESRESGIVSAAAVAICGASAALAVAAAQPKGSVSEAELARTIAGITLAGTVAMLGFPLLADVLQLGPQQTGVFLGATIHEVAQAAASGFTVSDEAGKTATIVKMLRVACLGLVVLGIGAMSRRSSAPGQAAPLLPMFLIAFIVLAVISSTGIIPEAVQRWTLELSRWCLLVAIAALGLRTSLRALVSAGPRPMLVIALNSLLIAALVLGGLLLIPAELH